MASVLDNVSVDQSHQGLLDYLKATLEVIIQYQQLQDQLSTLQTSTADLTQKLTDEQSAHTADVQKISAQLGTLQTSYDDINSKYKIDEADIVALEAAIKQIPIPNKPPVPTPPVPNPAPPVAGGGMPGQTVSPSPNPVAPAPTPEALQWFKQPPA